MSHTKPYTACDCYANSRFDPDGNLVLLFTCSSCLESALKKIKESVCNSQSGVVQLELHEGYGAEDSVFTLRPAELEKGRSE